MKVIFSDKALRNFTEIVDYIAKDSPQNAGLVSERIYAASQRLLLDPLIGRFNAVSNLRELVVSDTSFIIFYKVSTHAIRILKIQRSARRR